jgi:hypothetical protein
MISFSKNEKIKTSTMISGGIKLKIKLKFISIKGYPDK